jgi:hypothetical protein
MQRAFTPDSEEQVLVHFRTTGRFAVALIRVLYQDCHVALPRKLETANQILQTAGIIKPWSR